MTDAARFSRTALSYRTLPGRRGCLLLLHGMLTSHKYFLDPVAGRLDGFRLILPDMLGFGDSASPDASYTMEEHVACLADLVEAEGVPGPLFLGGHSLGCLVITALAARLGASRIRGLVFINYPRFTSTFQIHQTLRRGSPHYRRVTEGLSAVTDEDLVNAAGSMVQQFAAVLPPSLQEEAGRTSTAALAGTSRHCLFEYRPDPDLDVLAGLPMLHLHGGQDLVAPPAFIQERLRDFPGAKWKLFADAGHHLIHTHRDSVVAEIGSFLRANTGTVST